VLDVGARSWRRVGHSRRSVLGRAVVSGIVAVVGVWFLVVTATEDAGDWKRFIWPALTIFIAWRFVRLGLYTSEWGVRISNPVMTWWYPWSRVDHFELAPTGEMFAPKAKAIALVTTEDKKRLSWDLTTSGFLIRLSAVDQWELLAEVNRLAETKRAI
jgi:hypothetical protein